MLLSLVISVVPFWNRSFVRCACAYRFFTNTLLFFQSFVRKNKKKKIKFVGERVYYIIAYSLYINIYVHILAYIYVEYKIWWKNIDTIEINSISHKQQTQQTRTMHNTPGYLCVHVLLLLLVAVAAASFPQRKLYSELKSLFHTADTCTQCSRAQSYSK